LTGEGRNNNWFAYFRIPSILGYHPAKLKIYQDLIDEAGPVGITKPLSQGNFNVVNMLNMKYIVADGEITGAGLETVHRSEQVVMRNRSALPRMWFVDRARVVPDEQAHLRELANPAWNPAREALAFEDLGPLEPGSGGTAVVERSSPRDVAATVTSPGTSLLVLSEIYYDTGWKARLDDEEIPIHRVNYALRGVVVPAGTHRLTMRFDPPTFYRGILVSAASLAAILLTLAGSFVLGRRRRVQDPNPAST
jgi:hypothetical protein